MNSTELTPDQVANLKEGEAVVVFRNSGHYPPFDVSYAAATVEKVTPSRVTVAIPRQGVAGILDPVRYTFNRTGWRKGRQYPQPQGYSTTRIALYPPNSPEEAHHRNAQRVRNALANVVAIAASLKGRDLTPEQAEAVRAAASLLKRVAEAVRPAGKVAP